jgi:3-hydroxy acid dehydrogenase / malonic semialdehyde reductase
LKSMSRTVLITGATSGFGKAIAEKFAKEQWKCIITGRRNDRLTSLSEDLRKNYKAEILSLNFDIRNKEDVFLQIESLPPQWKSIEVLINNAGGAIGRDNFADAEIEDWETMIDTNLKGLLYMSKAVIPSMIKNKQGHIINIGSIAGKEVYENGNTYCASKHAVDAISKSMRIDLLKYKIKVTSIHPGAAETEFSEVRFKGDKEKAKEVYKDYTPLNAEDIANITWFCVSQPAHVCINDLVVTCTAQANSFYLKKDK